MNEIPNASPDDATGNMTNGLPLESRRGKAEKYDAKLIIIVISIVFLWIGLICVGYWFANSLNAKNLAYVDSKIEEQFKELEPVIAAINAEVDSLHDELLTINQMLASTGELLDDTGTNKVTLEKRINELNSQLRELQRAIERLQDAASN